MHVVAGSGLRGLTHRAVDARAGVPEGTCSAYLRTRLALLTALTEFVTAQFAQDIEALTARIEQHHGEPAYALRQTGTMLRSWLREPELLLVRMELAIEGSRQAVLGEIMQVQFHQLTRVVERALTPPGADDAHQRAATLIASLDGVLLRALREPVRTRGVFLARSLELLLVALDGPLHSPGPDPRTQAGH